MRSLHCVITDTEIAAVLARVDDVLRDLGVPAQTGACQCTRCQRQAAPVVASAPAKPDLPGGAPVENPHPRPVKPPSGATAPVRSASAFLRDLYTERPELNPYRPQRAADEISF